MTKRITQAYFAQHVQGRDDLQELRAMQHLAALRMQSWYRRAWRWMVTW